MKILITSGATREPIDEVRFVSNVSSGATGATLANALAARRHDVTLLRGEGAVAPKQVREEEVFSSAADLKRRLQARLATGQFEAVIMAAAVADYRPEMTKSGKISSDADRLMLTLVRNEKILPKIRRFSPRAMTVIGFKLTAGASEADVRAAVASQFASAGVNAVVHNDLTQIRAERVHPFWIYRPGTAAPEKAAGAEALAVALETICTLSVARA
jgi:phosphopantothenoylcysteine synthetase/decarboxylase